MPPRFKICTNFEISKQDFDFALEIKQKYNLNDYQSIKIEEWIGIYKNEIKK